MNGDWRGFEGAKEIYSPFRLRVAQGVTLRPEDFARDVLPEEQMTYKELAAFIHRQERNGRQALRESVALHMRLAFPFANFVIALFGLPMASRMRRTGRPVQIGLCLLICFVFYGSIQFGRAMGWNDIVAPYWGAWAPNLIFGLIGIILLIKTRK